MTLDEVMAALKKAGSEQTRKTWARHGMPEPFFGVKYGDLNALVKKVKVDHALAKALWKTGNGDARALALMIADHAAAKKAELESWAKDLGCYAHADALAKLAARTPHAQELLGKWTSADHEWIERAGWHVLAELAAQELPDRTFEPWLKQIGSRIHVSKNFVKDAMNTALIAIGGRSELLRARAEAVATKIGRVEVDWGETNCVTPSAIPYIAKIWAYKAGKAKAPMRVPAAKKKKAS